MLIVFPLGLLGGAIVFDIIHLARGGSWSLVAFYMIPLGIITGLLAAIFGLIDWTAIPSGTRAKSIGLWHAVGNVVVLALFAASWYLRRGHATNPATLDYVLSFAGFALAGVTGWLGGELVDRLGVGVHDGANLNAPSSIRTASVQADANRVRA
jgi:Predicted membrane protein